MSNLRQVYAALILGVALGFHGAPGLAADRSAEDLYRKGEAWAREVLGIGPDGALTEGLVNKFFRKAAIRTHPDKYAHLRSSDPQAYLKRQEENKTVNEARDLLKDLLKQGRAGGAAFGNSGGFPGGGWAPGDVPHGGTAVAPFGGVPGFEFLAAYKGDSGYVAEARVKVDGRTRFNFFWIPKGEDRAYNLVFGSSRSGETGPRGSTVKLRTSFLDTRYPSGQAPFEIQDGVLKVGGKIFAQDYSLGEQVDYAKAFGSSLKAEYPPEEGSKLGLYSYQAFKSPTGEIMVVAQPQEFMESDIHDLGKTRLFSHANDEVREFDIYFDRQARAFVARETQLRFSFASISGAHRGVPEYDLHTGTYFGSKHSTGRPLVVSDSRGTKVAELKPLSMQEMEDLSMIRILKDRIPVPEYLRTPLDHAFMSSSRLLGGTGGGCLSNLLFGAGK